MLGTYFISMFKYFRVFPGFNIPVTHYILEICSHSNRQIQGPKYRGIFVTSSLIRKQMREQVIFAIFFCQNLLFFFSFLSLPRSEFAISPQHHSEKEDTAPSSFTHSTLLFESMHKDSQRPDVEEGLLRRI